MVIDQPALTHLGYYQSNVPEVEVEEDVTERYLGMNSPYMGGMQIVGNWFTTSGV